MYVGVPKWPQQVARSICTVMDGSFMHSTLQLYRFNCRYFITNSTTIARHSIELSNAIIFIGLWYIIVVWDMYLYSKTKFCTLYNMVCCNQIHLNHSLDGLRFMCPFLSTKYVFIPTCHLLYLKRESTFCCFQIWNCWLGVAQKCQKWQELAL